MGNRSSEPPLPLVQAFLLCRDIHRSERTKEVILIGPTSHVPGPQFPANVRLSAFLQLIEVRGEYQLALSLRDENDDEVWGWFPPGPLEESNPLLQHHVLFYDLVLKVPRLGRYQLLLLANGHVLAQQSLWMGPAEAFRG